jgi:glycosyltransferase involved in cell wall biosynthesis
MVGRMVEHKGHDLLLRALAKLGPEGADIDICLVGDDDGTWATALRQLADTLGLSPRLHMLGYRKDVEPVLRAADALVQPSRSEALSLSLLEAMAVGLPVVAARVGGMPEVISHEDNGLLFASEQVDDLAEQLANLRNPLLRQRLGQRAHLTQRQRFSVATMVDETVTLYREVAGARA